MLNKKKINRRQFLKKATAATAGAIAFPYIAPSSALGKAGNVAASNRITLGFIGVGRQSHGALLKGFLNAAGTQVVAACDVDALKLKRAQDMVEKHYTDNGSKAGFKGCKGYKDFRDLLARNDIDAVVIVVPDHWHSIMVELAARAGKDIYCEKPLSLTISEAKAMVEAVDRYGTVFQTGSMQRSDGRFHQACELVRNGYIGQIKSVLVNISSGDYPMSPVECNLPAEPVPDYLDWNMWLGPAPSRPYNARIAPHLSNNVFPHWRDYYDYSGGLMTDWGAHHFDIVQWALGMDRSGPVEIIPADHSNHRPLTYKYANGVIMRRDDFGEKDNGVLFIGTEGTVEVSRTYLRTRPEKLIQEQIGPNDTHLYKSRDHYADWLQAIHTRSKPICDVETGCRSVMVCHLGNIASQLGRALKWDPKQQVFVNNPQANRLLSRPMRSPWHL